MIPAFPEFKKLEFGDRPDIEAVTAKYPPYSDFNFQSMWSWANGSGATLSMHRGNLVLSTEGYLSGRPYVSLLGDSDAGAAALDILEWMSGRSGDAALNLVPEVTAVGLDRARFSVEPDPDNSDYVYDLNLLATLPGGKFEDKRRKVRALLRKYPDAGVVRMDLSSLEVRDLLLEVNDLWSSGKSDGHEYRHLPKEEAAMLKFIETTFGDSYCFGAFSQGHLLGYSLYSTLPNGYSICHFTKGRVDAPGVYEFIMSRSAAMLREQGCALLNYQEDLGKPGLRFYKRSFRPADMLVKYTVKLAGK